MKWKPLLGALAAAVIPGGSRLFVGDAFAHEGHHHGTAPSAAPAGGVQALYATKAEAEAAAKRFHCTGTHAMGDKWMPCAMTGAKTGAMPGATTGGTNGH